MRKAVCPLGILTVFALVLSLLVCLVGCSDDDSEAVAPASEPLELAALTLPAPACNGFDSDPTPGDIYLYQECLEYSLKYDGTLVFHHASAQFNCCSDSIDVAVNLLDRTITITEKEFSLMGGCDCECPVDLDYEVSGIEPGVYTISVVDPYRCHSSRFLTLQFSVDLSVTPNGAFCIDRCARVE
jgi:hypothetical protein